MYKEIEVYELMDLMKNKNLNLIDIRSSYKFLLGSIENAKNIPVNDLLLDPSYYLDKDNEYYIFCNYGTTSKRVCQILAKRGYNVININGGYQKISGGSN